MAKYKEYHICAAIVRWWDFAYRSYGVADKRSLFHIANQGAHGSPKTGAILKNMGVRKGQPDYLLAVPRNGFNGLFLEVKTSTGKPSPEQLECHAMHRANGYAVEVVNSFDVAQKVIHGYLGKR